MIVLQIIATALMIIGWLIIIKERRKVKFYQRVQYEIGKYWETTVGQVISTEYNQQQSTNSQQPSTLMTPVVEYKVNGKKYIGKNARLSSNKKEADLPIGTKVKVYYSKTDPQECILQTYLDMEIGDFLEAIVLGAPLVFLGILFLLISLI
jgi:hypothetical protein